jgi:segregation and condensation protein B
LFAAGDSVEIRRIAKVLGVEPWEVRQTAESLAKEYEENNRGIRLSRMEENLQLVTAGEYSDVINRVLEKRGQPRLSPTALEVLSIVAYYQPVTRSYIEQLRGADSSYTVAMLSDRGLIAPCGKLDAPGRPVLFGTTEQFLRVMGISSLKELPPLKCPECASCPLRGKNCSRPEEDELYLRIASHMKKENVSQEELLHLLHPIYESL